MLVTRSSSLALAALLILLLLLPDPPSWAQGQGGRAAASGAMTIDQCVNEALCVNLQILKQQYQKQAAELESRAAFKEMLPSISTSYTYTGRRDAQTVTILGRRINITGHDRYSWDLTLHQPLFYGGLLWNRYRIADIQVDLEAMALEQAKNDIVKETKEQFYTILRNEKLVEEAEAAVRRLEALASDVEGFYKAGISAKTDLLQTRVELDRARLDLLKARHELEMSKDRLNLILRRRPGTPVRLKGELQGLTPGLDLDAMFQEALDSRPEVVQARMAVEQARRRQAVVRAEMLPKVDLVAQYAKEGITPDLSDNPYGDNDMAQVMVSASWDLFSWGSTVDSVEAARQRALAADTTLREVEDRVLFEVKSAYLLLTDALEGVKVASSALEQAEEDYRLTLARYKAQLASNTDTIDAQARLTAARSSYYSALAAAYIARARLEHAIGKEPGAWSRRAEKKAATR